MREDLPALCGESRPALGALEDPSCSESDWKVRRRLPDIFSLTAHLLGKRPRDLNRATGPFRPMARVPGRPCDCPEWRRVDRLLAGRTAKSCGNRVVISSFSPSGE